MIERTDDLGDKVKLVLSMAVRNEANRYLRQSLESHIPFVDHVVILDDNSEDDTVNLCREVLKDVSHTIISNDRSLFKNEVELRTKQWEETIMLNPEWILNLDADEIFEPKFADQVQQIIDSPDYDVVYFRLYDMWSETHYRDDQYWQAHRYYRPFMVRYRPEIAYQWKNTPLHCGRFPESITQLPYICHSARLKHFGWAREEDRKRKYETYKQLDPDANYGWKEQYESILDSAPHVIEWED